VLLWGVVFFTSLQLGLAAAIEIRFPELRDPEFAVRAARLVRRVARRAPPPATVVMLGSSRTTFGFRADQLEPELSTALGRPTVVFNFGIMGAGPLMQLIDLRRLSHLGLRPNLLLVEVLPPLLARQIPPAELYRLSVDRIWLGELDLLERYGRKSGEIRAAWCADWPVPWYSHRYAIVSRLAPGCLPTRARMDWAYHINRSGWVDGPVRQATPEGRRLATENARSEYAAYLNEFRIGGPACTALRELLSLCRDQHIRAAMVLMPEGSDFRSWYPPEAWQQIDAFLRRASAAFDAPIINAREWIADDQFSDSHHLLPSGAEKFTARLGREAIAPLLKQPWPCYD
jgi:hypothetical protein